MCLVLGIISDEVVSIASERALEGLRPVRWIEAAAELPGAVNAHRPLVVVASPKDRFGDAVVPYLAEVRAVRPQIGVVLISDGLAELRDRIRDLSSLGEIRSVMAGSREYAVNLRGAVHDQAERYRTEYILRAFGPHTPSNLLPLLYHCAHTWGAKLSANDVAAALKRDRHTIARWVSAAQPACGLCYVLRCHHFLDIAWRLWARREPFKALAREFKYQRPAKLRGRMRHWLGIDVRAPALSDVRGWENLVDRFLDEFTGRRHRAPRDEEPLQH